MLNDVAFFFVDSIAVNINFYFEIKFLAIEIINPRRTGGFVPPASRAIRYGITQRLNPQIASIFSKREYGTNIPKGGLPMILRTSKYFSDKRVEVYTSNDEFKLKIYGV